MGKWKYDLTVNDILNYSPEKIQVAETVSKKQQSGRFRTGPDKRTDTSESNGKWVSEFLMDVPEGVRASNPNEEIVVMAPGEKIRGESSGR